MSKLLIVLALSGCVTKGRNFPTDVSWIKKEQTRQQDVLMILGRPFMVGSSAGITTWSYGFYHYRVVGPSYVKELKFFWNDDKTVRDYSFQSSFPNDFAKAGLRKVKQRSAHKTR